jgi:hypothetical protein
MGKKMGWIMGILLLTLCVAVTSQAALVFRDDFNAENGGVAGLNYNAFSKWNITNGTVDLIGVGSSWDYYPGNGLYVDLDGSTNQAGTMSTRDSFGPGTYTLTFDLGGNSKKTGNDVVLISLGSWSKLLTLNSTDDLTNFVFPVTTNGGSLIFSNTNGGDNVGPILDNVLLSSVPLPPSLLLFAPGLFGLVALRRKFKG